MNLRVTARVPGKVMLAGEYAVLLGEPCLACTVDRYLELSVKAGSGSVCSELWPEALHWPTIPLELRAREPLLQMLAFIDTTTPVAEISVEVRSQLDPAHGLGSSTAVRLAALMAIEAFAKPNKNLDEASTALAKTVWQLQCEQQGFASGYDALTQTVGGLIAWSPTYERWPGPYEKLSSRALARSVHVWIGGRGAPTATVGGAVRRWLAENRLEGALRERSNRLVSALKMYLNDGSALDEVCRATRAHRELFLEAPAYPRHVLERLASLDGFDQRWTFKTTGAGGEDALLLIGDQQDLSEAFQSLRSLGWEPLAAAFTDSGATVQTISQVQS